MSTQTEITEQELNEVDYQDLKAKFTELGIPDVWKGGKKKVDLIKAALEALAEVKVNVASDGEEIIVKGDGPEIIEESVDAETASKIVIEKDELEEAVPAEEIELTQDQIRGLLKTIKQNLLCGVPSHRDELLASQEKFEALLED